MTKKDYELISKTINSLYSDLRTKEIEGLTYELSCQFKEKSQSFKQSRFITQCLGFVPEHWQVDGLS